MSPPRLDQPFVIGALKTPGGTMPQIPSRLSRSDFWGAVRVRANIGRMDYRVDPGLYALGDPDERSSVLVTANYKLSFDYLRRSLPDRDLWILVLDTDGINVWCAAGKGTFGTQELIRRIESSGLSRVVTHRQLILPQLGAPGVAAHQVKRASGFEVIYGPILAIDLPVYLDNGLKATAEMRRKTFSVRERAVLIPVELAIASKPGLIMMVAFFLLAGFGAAEGYWAGLWSSGRLAALCILAAFLAGAVLTPLLLPWLPGRAFSLKGALVGLVLAAALLLLRLDSLTTRQVWLEMAAWLILIPALSAYLAMNFTGASTYTSLSGVRKEMRWAVPMEATGAVVGLAFFLASRFVL